MLFSILGFEISGPVLALGAITGMTYGVLAVGLVLIYRSNRILNLAHGEIGAFGAALLGLAVTRWGVPYWVAFPFALAGSASVGAVAEIAVIRRLRKAPALMSIVATLGLAQFLLLLTFVILGQLTAAGTFPQPTFLPTFHLGALRVTSSYFGMLFLTPLFVAGLALFLRGSRWGLAIRGAAANPEAARLSGVVSSRMSTLSWAIAGSLAAFTAILVFPARGLITAEALGPGLLLRALVPAVVARMHSLPGALVSGIAVGILEQQLLWNYPRGGLVEAVLFVVLLGALFLQPRHGGREEEKGAWAAVQPWRPLPDAFRRVWTIRNLGWIATGAGLLFALGLPIVMTNSAAVVMVSMMAFALVGVSIAVVTGLGGQLSLGQFALAGIGATVSYHIMSRTGNYLFAFAAAGLMAAAVSAAIGLPALRIRGLMLAVTTLSFALAAQAWLFQQPWMLSDGVDPGRPVVANLAMDTSKKYYMFTLVFLGFGLWLARNIRKTGIGRRLVALRDNEEGARAFTVPVTAVKLQGFVLAGFIAGIGGAIYGHLLSRVSAQAFPVEASVNVVAMSVLGGIGVLAGPLIGALYILGVPRFIPLDSAGLAASAFGWLVLILYFPGGIAQLLRPLRERLVDWLARRDGLDPVAIRAGSEAGAEASAALQEFQSDARERPESRGGIILEGTELRKHFGGVRALDGVSLRVEAGETLGLIGPNGAGKTTLFEVLGGFTKPDAGGIAFAGRDVSSLAPEARGKLGLIRSFQDASLFPTMTVLEAIKLGLERSIPTRLFRSLAGFHKDERDKEERAHHLIQMMGLEPFRTKQINELSTGTRRITELACLMALEPVVLLLDEPSSGIAQRETETLGRLLSRLKDHLDISLLIIEHDIPLIMGLSDRVIAMESGRVIAEGTPDEVRANPLVIESYLGGDVQAIERSGVMTRAPFGASGEGSGNQRCRGVTRSERRCSRRATMDGYCAQHYEMAEK